MEEYSKDELILIIEELKDENEILKISLKNVNYEKKHVIDKYNKIIRHPVIRIFRKIKKMFRR